MSDHRCGGGARSRLMTGAAQNTGAARTGVARGLAVSMLVAAGVGGCSSSPAYPTQLGERPGDGSVIAVQPRYPISSRDAAQNAADRASQQGAGRPGYPAYGAPSAAPAQAAVYGAPPAAPPPPADDEADDAPRPIPHSSVDSSDLPPPAPTAPPAGQPNGGPAPGEPQAISYGGGQIVFGTDSVGPPPLEFAAYHHRRHRAEPVPAAADTADASDSKPAAPRSKSRRHRRAAESDAVDAAPAATAADTPYQTIVRPGEKLAQVAERVHSSPSALTALNDLKHPRHVKPGTVLKIPYRYNYEVQKGDTLYTIAHRFDQDPQAIARLNGLKAVPTLQPGQSIDLPPTVEDTGKRDHAAASAPSPVAAPEKLAAAALRKAERHGRHRRAEATAVETASADTASPAPVASEETPRSRHARRRQEATLAAAAPPMASPPTPAPASEVHADAAEDAGRPSPRPYTSPVAGQAVAPSAATYAGVRPAAPVAGAVAGYGYRPAQTPPAPAVSYRTAAAPQPAYHAPAPAPTYRTPAPTPSTYAASPYAAPAYAARAPAVASDDTARVASLTPPRYAPTYPAGGFSPSLGRERPTAPALSAGALTPTEIAAAGRGRFVWPLRGQLISGFGDKGTGQHNDGVDIAAIAGSGVRAAAAGEVVYAGSSIPGFGNLVLVKHPGGWVTAYAHLDRIEVRMRDSVSQGEEIGLAGQTGAVDRPQLHFEVRYAPDPADKARPVDPALVLPGG